MVMLADTRGRVDALERMRGREPNVVRLARLLSLAARIEPALLRRMRLSVLPDADIGIESDLWWSALVQVRDPIAMVLLPHVRRILREELRHADQGREIERAWSVIEHVHRDAPPVMRLEEAVTYHALRGNLEAVDRHLAGALDAMARDSGTQIARWAARTLPRLPVEARTSEVTLALAKLASEALDGIEIPDVLGTEAGVAPWSHDLLQSLPRAVVTIQIRVEPLGGTEYRAKLELRARAGDAELSTHALSVPHTRPLVVEILVPTPNGWDKQRVSLTVSSAVTVDIPAGPALRLRSLLGNELMLRPEPGERRAIGASSNPLFSSLLVAEADDLGWEIAGYDADASAETRLLIDTVSPLPAFADNPRAAIRAHLLQRERRLFAHALQQSTAPFRSASALLERKRTHFVLWLPSFSVRPPSLILEDAQGQRTTWQLAQSPTQPTWWERPALYCGVHEGGAYSYWFEVQEPRTGELVSITDPLAQSLVSTVPETFASRRRSQTRTLVRFVNRELVPCDAHDTPLERVAASDSSARPPLSRLVIYRIPTRALNFEEMRSLFEAVGVGHALQLGVNALQCNVADPHVASAPARELGPPAELRALIEHVHGLGVRFIAEHPRGGAQWSPYRDADPSAFHGPPMEESFARAPRFDRFDFGVRMESDDPISGKSRTTTPATQLLLTQLTDWFERYRIDGFHITDPQAPRLRLPIVDLVREARAAGFNSASDQPLFTGEDSEPAASVDAVWSRRFLETLLDLMSASAEKMNIEAAIRLLIGLDLAANSGPPQINFLSSPYPNLRGSKRHRIFDMLRDLGVPDIEGRLKLAFACLLTVVGTPAFAAGDEFGDTDTRSLSETTNETVNFELLADPLRHALLEHVARLVKLRTSHPALAGNTAALLHTDFEGKRLVAWQRGDADDPVVVVANFSSFESNHEYLIPNWPSVPAGGHWREVTSDRLVHPLALELERIRPWEAKVYVLEREPTGAGAQGLWVLVAGTGAYELTDVELWVAEALGAALSNAGFGLITGGWRGVDHVVARAFEQGAGPGRLIHVLAEGETPDYPGGMTLTESKTKEFEGALARSHAAILVGGRGGTLEIYRNALIKSLPVYPIAATGGDAAIAFEDLSRSAMDEHLRTLLSTPITRREDADTLSYALVTAIAHRLREVTHPRA